MCATTKLDEPLGVAMELRWNFYEGTTTYDDLLNPRFIFRKPYRSTISVSHVEWLIMESAYRIKLVHYWK